MHNFHRVFKDGGIWEKEKVTVTIFKNFNVLKLYFSFHIILEKLKNIVLMFLVWICFLIKLFFGV